MDAAPSECTPVPTDVLNMTVGQTSGRIKVFTRPRALEAHALADRGGSAIECVDRDEISVTDERGKCASYGFDRVFPTTATNANLFEEVGRPLVTSVLCGYHSTLMAYGQTGSGKTHSLASGDGLINQMLGHLYRSIDEDAAAEFYRVTISYVQVYNERVYDLLHPTETERALPLRESKAQGGVYLEGVSEHRATSLPDVLDLLAFGRTRLHFAETRMNRHSSRSHAVCVIKVERTVGGPVAAELSSVLAADSQRTDGIEGLRAGEDGAAHMAAVEAASDEADERAAAQLALSHALDATSGGEVAVSARLTLVDLAGSERVKRTGASGTTFAEARNINVRAVPAARTRQVATCGPHLRHSISLASP